ncbi:MAG: zinc-binding dehydrogenase [Gemmatimonadetes bacterium]|nr:zinc-binding dehydrogenase [Gemmatimonadota bacterium]MBT6145435.1 zinc-binding dehydrogenase [Gemmatimonadota bacterium]MBT7862150.1 zinc-binding dehydrogenase [Gemmatimonadota bacterium]
MQSARLIQPRQWELLDLDVPTATQDQMLVRLERVAICGTDKPAWIGLADEYPLAPGNSGHEGMGIVESCPSGRYEVGERVLLYGFDRPLFQQYVLARDDGGCIRLPSTGELDVMLMSQLFGTVLHAFYKLDCIIGQDAVVMGQGPVGQLFNAALRNLGARRIIAVDPQAHRLAIATQMGATHTLPQGDGLEAQVRSICDGELPQLVVEAVGKEETFQLAASLLRRNGTLLYFGVPNKEEGRGVMSIDFLRMFVNETRIITTVGPNPQVDYRPALQWIMEERIDVRPILTHTLPFAEIQQAFTMAFEEPEAHGAVKVVLTFD